MEGTTATECREAVRAAATHLAHLREVLFQVPCTELGALAGELDELARQTDTTALAMVLEADTRGVVAQSSSANTPDWLMSHMRGLAPGEATRLARVATACRDPRNRPLAEAVLDGRVGTRNAAVALCEVDKLRPRLAAGAEEQVVGWFTQVATDGLPTHLRQLRRRILAMHGHEDAFQRDEDLLKRGCSLTKAVHDDGMSLESLHAGLGHGTTLTGELLAPETVRKMACDATVVPVALAGDGGVLDVGRLRRLATPRLLAALWVRDAGCTFPGCTRPAPWCHAHHVRHWVSGGPTDLANLALLCARHHTVVHQRADRDRVGLGRHLAHLAVLPRDPAVAARSPRHARSGRPRRASCASVAGGPSGWARLRRAPGAVCRSVAHAGVVQWQNISFPS